MIKISRLCSASEMTYIVSRGTLSSTQSLSLVCWMYLYVNVSNVRDRNCPIYAGWRWCHFVSNSYRRHVGGIGLTRCSSLTSYVYTNGCKLLCVESYNSWTARKFQTAHFNLFFVRIKYTANMAASLDSDVNDVTAPHAYRQLRQLSWAELLRKN